MSQNRGPGKKSDLKSGEIDFSFPVLHSETHTISRNFEESHFYLIPLLLEEKKNETVISV